MTPAIIPILAANRNGNDGGNVGFAIGFLIVAVFIISCWFVRPLIFPRIGTWQGNSYVINGSIEGNVYSYLSGEWSAYSNPPFWVGAGHFNKYTTIEAAKKDVEESCR